VIRSFRDHGTEDVFDGSDTSAARKTCPGVLRAIARRKLDQINRASDLRDLAVPPGNRLERLKGSRSGQQSIRINEQYRVCFRWEDGDAHEVEITDYH
jgi:proteic killer suppression protein